MYIYMCVQINWERLCVFRCGFSCHGDPTPKPLTTGELTLLQGYVLVYLLFWILWLWDPFVFTLSFMVDHLLHYAITSFTSTWLNFNISQIKYLIICFLASYGLSLLVSCQHQFLNWIPLAAMLLKYIYIYLYIKLFLPWSLFISFNF